MKRKRIEIKGKGTLNSDGIKVTEAALKGQNDTYHNSPCSRHGSTIWKNPWTQKGETAEEKN